MSTLREVAQQAGVSVKTASVVLSGRADENRISSATRQRVRHAAEELHYHRNSLARTLQASKSDMVGIICRTDPQHQMIRTRAAASCLIKAGYQVSMQDLAWNPTDETAFLKDLLSLQAEGVLLASGASPFGEFKESHRILSDLARRSFPLVRFDDAQGLPIDVVTVDREQGAYLATKHLLALGHRRIACAIDKDSSFRFIQQRVWGYRKANQEWGVPVREELFIPIDIQGGSSSRDGYAAGQRAMNRVLVMSPRPTALLAANDYVALGAMSVAIEQGVQIPDDIAVVGFTGLPEAELSPIPLTTMVYPAQAMAERAVEMLLERIGGSSEPPRVVTLTPELAVRRSCGASAVDSGLVSIARGEVVTTEKEVAAGLPAF